MHCLQQVDSGGVEQRRLLLARGLDSSRFEQILVCTEAHEPLVGAIRESGVEVIETGPVRSILDTHRYIYGAQIMRKWQPDIVHGAVMEGYALAVVAGRLASVPKVIMEETSDPQNRRWKGHVLSRLLASGADVCVGVSPSVGRYLVDGIRIPKSRVRVIANGVSSPSRLTAVEIEEIRTAYGFEAEDIVIGGVGRMVDDEHKRFSDLIKAAAKLLNSGRRVRLLLVGDGPVRPMLESVAVSEGIASCVSFAGYQSDVGPYYAAMDVFALSSAREAFGLVVAEAMRAGLPVVGTAVGGVPDIIIDGETGFLVPARDPAALAEALSSLADDSALRVSMGQAGRLRADCHFSAERYVADVSALYESLSIDRSL